MKKTTRLRERLKDGKTLFVPGCYNALSARILDKVGFDARNTGGVFFSRSGETGLATFIEGQERSRMLSTLRHEGFHQFAHARIGDTLPIWVNEGLAEYFGHGAIVRGRLRVGFAPSAPLERVRMGVENDFSYSFGEMLSMTNEQWGEIVRQGGANAGLLYDQAWLMTHFLVHGDGGRYTKAFEKYLKLVADGTDSLRAFADAFGSSDTVAFENAWIRWLEEATPDPISTAGERVEFLMRGVRFLHEQGVSISTIAELKNELRRRGFAIRSTSHGIERVTSSLDDHVFQAPKPLRGRGRSSIGLIPTTNSTSLATVRITGLSLDVYGEWVMPGAGGVGGDKFEVVYR